MITLHDTQQGSEEWNAARYGHFTGSNAYKLLTSFGAHEFAKAFESDFTGNFYTERGHILEDEAIQLYEAITGHSVIHCGFVTNDLYSDCLYSPDGLTDSLVVEVKCFSEKPHMELYNGNIPTKILAQIHFGMMLCEKRGGQLVIYNPKFAQQFDENGIPNPNYDPKKAFKIIDIAYNQKIIDNFRRILEGVRV